MKNRIWLFLLIVGLVFLVSKCKKDDNIPTTVTDLSGNIYNVIHIEKQYWMAENLKTTKLNDSTAIPLVVDSTAWVNLTTPGYCYYNNNETTYKDSYGALYNWYTVNTGKLCPQGWHVPSDKDWDVLTVNIGGQAVAGGKLKEIGTIHWISPNQGATDEFGFTALPGGERDYLGPFMEIGTIGFLWSTTETSVLHARNMVMSNTSATLASMSYMKAHGFSVRCLMD